MNTANIFQAVADRTITPEQGARAVLEAEREMRETRRPSWMPSWMYTAAGVVGAMLLAMVGIRQNQN